MEIALDDPRWDWGGARRTPAGLRGRRCIRLGAEGLAVVTLRGVEPAGGAIELDVAVEASRSFHGVFWRGRAGGNYESFFLRPHQSGNPDAVQYTPVFNGTPGWQLYHGDGFWSPVTIPPGDWMTLRVVTGGDTAEIFAGDPARPALVARLRHAPGPGSLGLLVAGEGLHVARFAVEPDARPAAVAHPLRATPGAILDWEVSAPFAEGSDPDPSSLAWTPLRAEPSGLADLARVHVLGDALNTVYARATIDAPAAREVELAFGFSDRAVVRLNGRRLYRGDCTFRSRDYRFLGSIGWWDALMLPLQAGPNELLMAVSEDVGGWGVQARLL